MVRGRGPAFRVALTALLVAVAAPAAGLVTAPHVSAAPMGAAPTSPCRVSPGGPFTAVPWPQQRLDFQQVWPLTTGAGVRVAVIDTGIDRNQAQMSRVRVDGGRNVIPGFRPDDVQDCSGHGTAVTGIIAAPRVDDSGFVGVAPGVTVVPVKQTNTQGDDSGQASGIAAGIDAAVAAKADVVNISVTVPRPDAGIAAAVARARSAGVVIVAAAGNDGHGNNLPAYPAAYSTDYDNVIAVSASDRTDQIAQFSETGSYVTVAAPGVGVIAPTPLRGYAKVDGTSFAAPYVTGTVALVLATHPGLTPAQVRARLAATADRPPASVPDRRYGWGVVNPALAVTSVRDDTLTPASAAPAVPLPPRAVGPAPDRRLQHLALGSSLALLGVAALVLLGAVVLRRRPVARAPR